MRILLLIGILSVSLNLFSQNDLIVPIEDVKIGMSPEETLKVTGEPAKKAVLTTAQSKISIEIWNYRDDSGAFVHSVEFTDGKVSRVVPDYEQYQEEVKRMTELHTK